MIEFNASGKKLCSQKTVFISTVLRVKTKVDGKKHVSAVYFNTVNSCAIAKTFAIILMVFCFPICKPLQ